MNQPIGVEKKPEQSPSVFTRTLLSVAVAAACGLNVTPASAQATQQEATGLEEIVVTARFKEEKLQETPIAITAVTGEELQSRGFQNAFEIAYTVPNASLRPAQAAFGASMSAYIRGIGQYDFLPEFEPGVAIYFDDVLHPVIFASSVDLMDLERVEVLRGPQGTLFGRGSIGGAIRYISKAPQGDDTGNISVTYGDFNRIDIRASYDFKLSDTVFARVSGVSKKRDGYQTVYDFACRNPLLAGRGDGLAADGADADTLPDVVAAGSAADNAFSIPRRTQNRGAELQGGDTGRPERHRCARRVALRAQRQLRPDVHRRVHQRRIGSARRHAGAHRPSTPDDRPHAGAIQFLERCAGGTHRRALRQPLRAGDIYTSYATYQDPVTGFTTNPQDLVRATGIQRQGEHPLLRHRVAGVDRVVRQVRRRVRHRHGPVAVQRAAGGRRPGSSMPRPWKRDSRARRARSSTGRWARSGTRANSPTPSRCRSRPSCPPRCWSMARTPRARRTSRALRTACCTSATSFSLNAGVRYSTDQKDEEFDNSIVVTQLDTDESHFDWKAGIDYKFTEDMMVYASAATGYRPQAFNPRPFQPTQFVPGGWRRGHVVRSRLQERFRGQPRARESRGVLRRLQPAHPAGGRHRVHVAAGWTALRLQHHSAGDRHADSGQPGQPVRARSLRAPSTRTSRRRSRAPSWRCSSRRSRD